MDMEEDKLDALDRLRGFHHRYGMNYDKFISKVNGMEAEWIRFYTLEEVLRMFPNNLKPEEEELEIEDGQVMEGELMDPPDTGPVVNEPIKRWYTDEIIDLVDNSNLVNSVLNISTKDLPDSVRRDVHKNSKQILSRCNNPNDWGKNKQGLVFGMVQSGKTMSMVNVASQAFCTGYKIVIVFAGDKNSLRTQSQDRFNESFRMNVANQAHGLWTPTTNDDITQTNIKTAKGFFNSSMIVERNAEDNSWGVFIIMKKQMHQLEKLLEWWGDFESWIKATPALHDNVEIKNGNVHLPTLIIDDESHYASIDTVNPENTAGKIAKIHDLIEQITKKITCNTYVGYTATPQSVIAAREDKYNYPSDFIWLLEPDFADEERTITSSYLGGNEFFHTHSNQLLSEVSENIWPHNQKNWNGKNVPGVFYPGNDNEPGGFRNGRLTSLEDEFLDEILNNDRQIPDEFIKALLEFIVGGGIRWFNHYTKWHKDRLIIDMTESFIQSGQRKDEEFPFHAIMFNLSFITDNHSKLAQVLGEIGLPLIIDIWHNFKVNNITDERLTSTFREYYERGNIVQEDVRDVEYFIGMCLNISKKTIRSAIHGGKIYIVNSENDKLQYGNNFPDNERVKKAAIIIGGNILAMGLTIEGLAISFYTRTQNDSKMDTNLQMCRWFGHKRGFIYAVKLFTLRECARIFKDIADADSQLRREVKKLIKLDRPPSEVMISLRNSPFFRTTSAAKSYYIVDSEDHSYTGSVSALKEPKFGASEIIYNSNLVEKYKSYLDGLGKVENAFNRADLYRDVDEERFTSFLKGFKCDKEARSISPEAYLDYLDAWKQRDGAIPKINVAIWKKPGKRKRSFGVKLNVKEHDLEFAKKKHLNLFESIVGGRSDNKKFLGDRFLDFPEQFHLGNINTNSKELYSAGWAARNEILFIFYKLDPNYICKTKLKGFNGVVKLDSKDDRYIDSKGKLLYTFAVVTPQNGPMWQCGQNFTLVGGKTITEHENDLNNEE